MLIEYTVTAQLTSLIRSFKLIPTHSKLSVFEDTLDSRMSVTQHMELMRETECKAIAIAGLPGRQTGVSAKQANSSQPTRKYNKKRKTPDTTSLAPPLPRTAVSPLPSFFDLPSTCRYSMHCLCGAVSIQHSFYLMHYRMQMGIREDNSDLMCWETHVAMGCCVYYYIIYYWWRLSPPIHKFAKSIPAEYSWGNSLKQYRVGVLCCWMNPYYNHRTFLWVHKLAQLQDSEIHSMMSDPALHQHCPVMKSNGIFIFLCRLLCQQGCQSLHCTQNCWAFMMELWKQWSHKSKKWSGHWVLRNTSRRSYESTCTVTTIISLTARSLILEVLCFYTLPCLFCYLLFAFDIERSDMCPWTILPKVEQTTTVCCASYAKNRVTLMEDESLAPDSLWANSRHHVDLHTHIVLLHDDEVTGLHWTWKHNSAALSLDFRPL